MDEKVPTPKAVEAGFNRPRATIFTGARITAIAMIIAAIIATIGGIFTAAISSANRSASSTVSLPYHGPVSKWPTTVQEAAAAVNVDSSLVNHYIPGGPDDKPAGWVFGDNTTVFSAFLPAGTCVDFDPRSTTIQGSTYWTDTTTEGRARAYMESNGLAVGAYSLTVYWTPCLHLV